MNDKIISISLLNANLLNPLPLKNISHLHLDIIDTTFAENISFGPQIINDILNLDFVSDIHFMIANPLSILPKINVKRLRRAFFHSEVNFDELKEKYPDMSIGLALRPNESIELLKNKDIDSVLLMTVNPGHGGQEFLPCPEKIDEIKKHYNYEIAVDGGISSYTIEKMKECDYFVVGSAYFKAEDKEKYIEELKYKIMK